MNKHQIEAERVNLALLSKTDKTFGKGYANYNLYLFRNCGHIQNIDAGKVRTGKFQCRECIEIKIKTEAKEAGLTFISKSEKDSNNSHRKYKKDGCS